MFSRLFHYLCQATPQKTSGALLSIFASASQHHGSSSAQNEKEASVLFPSPADTQ